MGVISSAKALKVIVPPVLGLTVGLAGGSIATSMLYDKFFAMRQVNVLIPEVLPEVPAVTPEPLPAPPVTTEAEPEAPTATPEHPNPKVTKGAVKALQIGLGVLFAASIAATVYGVYKEEASVSAAIKKGAAFVELKLNDGVVPMGNKETLAEGLPDFSAFPTITQTPTGESLKKLMDEFTLPTIFISLKSIMNGFILPDILNTPSNLPIARIAVSALLKR